MKVVFFDPAHRDDLFPFTLTRPVSDLRKGILTIRGSWDLLLGKVLRIFTEATPGDFYLNAALLPDAALGEELATLRPGEGFFEGDMPLAYRREESGAPPSVDSLSGTPP